MNLVILSGRVSTSPELRSLASGKAVATFSMATVDEDDLEEQYHAIVAWNEVAQNAALYLVRGQKVEVEGTLRTRSWDDMHGQRHHRTEVVISRFHVLSGHKPVKKEAPSTV